MIEYKLEDSDEIPKSKLCVLRKEMNLILIFFVTDVFFMFFEMMSSVTTYAASTVVQPDILIMYGVSYYIIHIEHEMTTRIR